MTDERKAEPNVITVGGGGVGFYFCLAMLRAINDPKRIHLWDADDLRGGLGHARLPVASPETRKVDLLRGFARVAMGDMPPTTHDAMFTGVECEAGDIIVDCSDATTGTAGQSVEWYDANEPTSRAAIWARARAKGARCIRISYDGAMSTVVVAEGLPLETASTTRQQGGGGYSNLPTMALSFLAGGMGAEVISKVVKEEAKGYIEFQVSVNELLGLAAPEMH